jgi:hypothetical protein
MADKTYIIDPKFIGSTVTVYPSIDGIYQNPQGFDYVIAKDLPTNVLEYLVNIGHPAVSATVKEK